MFRNQWTTDEKRLTVELLEVLAEVFSRSESDYFLTFGSLLGFARIGGILHWDDDVDLVVIDGGDLDEITSSIRDRGYMIEYYPQWDSYKMYFQLNILSSEDVSHEGTKTEFTTIHEAVRPLLPLSAACDCLIVHGVLVLNAIRLSFLSVWNHTNT